MLEVTAAIIRQQDRVLITKRPPEDKHPLKWEFPGGKLEAGETPEDCLKREILEELNLNVEVLNLFGVVEYSYSWGSIRLIAYEARILSGQMELKVHYAAHWAPIRELENYDFLPADIDLLKMLKEKYPS
jgi:8-oxo-dGTP diphosphatase